MTDHFTNYENLDNVEACPECGTFHYGWFLCPEKKALEEQLQEQVNTARKGFCPYHPDQPLRYVRDDFGEERPFCPLCEG